MFSIAASTPVFKASGLQIKAENIIGQIKKYLHIPLYIYIYMICMASDFSLRDPE